MQFHTLDMTCQGCVNSIRKAVTGLDADARIEADLPRHALTITTARPRAEVAAVIEAAGFRLEAEA